MMPRSDARKQYIEQIYLILYGFYVFITIISYSLLNRGFIQTYGRFAIIAALIILYFNTRDFKWTLDKLALGVITALVLVVSANNTWKILACFLFFLCADLVEFRLIVKTSLVVGLATTILVVVSCMVGIVDNYKFARNTDRIEILQDHVSALGFSYYTTIPFLLLFFFLMYLYLRKSKMKWLEIILWTVVDFAQMAVFTCRLVGLIWFVGIVVYIIYVKCSLIKEKGFLIKFVSKYGFILCFVFVLVLSVLYNENSEFMYNVVNLRIFNHRIEYANKGFLNYGIHPFGQLINFYGTTDIDYGGLAKSDYNYIDIGYIRSIICHGPIFLTIILAIYTYLMRRATENVDKIIVVWGICVMVFTMVNNVWIDLDYNPLLLYIPSVLLANDNDSIIKKILWGQDNTK